MNELYKQIDPDGNIVYTDIFSQKDEVYSGSEATVFHIVKLFALKDILKHEFPIVVDSFRAEDLSTGKENAVLDIAKKYKDQIIFTTTLKSEEIGKYDLMEGINHIDYQPHTPSKILDVANVKDFEKLLEQLSIRV
ncbi:MAG: hypothetical protein ACLRRS_04875 [Faecalibacterium prausnitzii]